MDKLDFNGYQEFTASVAIYKEAITTYVESLEIPDAEKRASLIELLSLSYTVFGQAGEAGELCNKLKKVIRDGAGKLTPEFKETMVAENGDVTWYNAETYRNLNTSFEDGANANRVKLTSRKERGVLSGSGDNR